MRELTEEWCQGVSGVNGRGGESLGLFEGGRRFKCAKRKVQGGH